LVGPSPVLISPSPVLIGPSPVLIGPSPVLIDPFPVLIGPSKMIENAYITLQLDSVQYVLYVIIRKANYKKLIFMTLMGVVFPQGRFI